MRLLKKEKTYNDIIYYIISENLQVNDRIPTERELCEKFKVSRITLRDAMQRLIDEKILRRDGRNGTLIENLPVKTLSAVETQNQIIFVYFPSRKEGFMEHTGTAPEQIYRGIERFVHEKDDILMLQTGDNFLKTNGNLLSNIRGVILGGNIEDAAFAKIEQYNIPAVIVGYPAPLSTYNAISCDHFEAGYIACKKIYRPETMKRILFLSILYEGENRLQSGYREIREGIKEFRYLHQNIEMFDFISLDKNCCGDDVESEAARLHDYILKHQIDGIVASTNLLEKLLLHYEATYLKANERSNNLDICIVTSEHLPDKSKFKAVLLNIHKVGYYAAKQLYQQFGERCAQPQRIVLPIEA